MCYFDATHFDDFWLIASIIQIIRNNNRVLYSREDMML